MSGFVDVFAYPVHGLGDLAVAALLMQTVEAGSESVDDQRALGLDALVLVLESRHALFKLREPVKRPVVELVSPNYQPEDHRACTDDLSEFDNINLHRYHRPL